MVNIQDAEVLTLRPLAEVVRESAEDVSLKRVEEKKDAHRFGDIKCGGVVTMDSNPMVTDCIVPCSVSERLRQLYPVDFGKAGSVGDQKSASQPTTYVQVTVSQMNWDAVKDVMDETIVRRAIREGLARQAQCFGRDNAPGISLITEVKQTLGQPLHDFHRRTL